MKTWSFLSKTMFFATVSLLTTLSLVAQAVPEQNQIYRVTLPGTSSTCLEEAEGLSSRFQIATGIKQVKAECSTTQTTSIQGRDYTFNTLTLYYSTHNQLPIFKVRFGHYEGGLPGGINSVGDYYGAYESYSSCIQNINFRNAEFEKYTGLSAVSSYCAKGRIDGNYVLTIDSFGQPKMRLYTFDAGNWSKGEEISKYLFRKKASTVHTKGTRFYYYAKNSLNLGQHRLLSYQDGNICSDQLEVAKNIIKNYGSDSTMVRCVKRAQTNNDNFHLIALFSGSNFFKTRYMNERYVSYEQCLSDISRVMNEYSSVSRNVPFGALCSKNSISTQEEKFIMEIFAF